MMGVYSDLAIVALALMYYLILQYQVNKLKKGIKNKRVNVSEVDYEFVQPNTYSIRSVPLSLVIRRILEKLNVSIKHQEETIALEDKQ